MNVEERLNHARELRKQGKHREAISVAKSVLESGEEEADAWWLTALSLRSLGQSAESLAALKQTLRLAPRFGAGWAQYGVALDENGQPAEATKALEHALKLEPQQVFARRNAARVCEKQGDADGQIRHLSALDRNGKADSDDLNSLGIACWNRKHYSEAIDYYRRSAAAAPDVAPYFNLSLVYGDPEVSQDLDAVDSLHRALALKPDYKRARDRLATIAPKLQLLATQCLEEGETLLNTDECFQFYLNPFELIGVSHSEDVDALDSKTIQRLKKRLLQEMDLEDGHVAALEGVFIDRSRAVGSCDELNNDELRRFHAVVFRNPILLWFLTRGDIRHFLYTDYYLPLDLLGELDSTKSRFAAWLSEPFAKQYNIVLSRALSKGAVSLIEVLFDGRRWVRQEHDDLCLAGAHRHVERLLAPFKEAVKEASDRPPMVSEIEKILKDSNRVGVMNLLPEQFREQQAEAVRSLRDIAIACYNEHADSDLSKAILSLSKKFVFKSEELRQRLERDFHQIEKLIAEERKHEAKLTLGKEAMEITKDGARMGNRFLATRTVASIRWGIVVTGNPGAPAYEFLIVFRDDNLQEAVFSWRSSNNFEQQEVHFQKLVQAALTYIVPDILTKVQRQLDQGEHVRVGKCVMRRAGVSFEMQRWFSNKTHIVPWTQVATELKNGILTVFDRANRTCRTEMALRDSENAIVLRILAANAKDAQK